MLYLTEITAPGLCWTAFLQEKKKVVCSKTKGLSSTTGHPSLHSLPTPLRNPKPSFSFLCRVLCELCRWQHCIAMSRGYTLLQASWGPHVHWVTWLTGPRDCLWTQLWLCDCICNMQQFLIMDLIHCGTLLCFSQDSNS